MMLLFAILLSIIPLTEGIYKGEGQIYCTHRYQSSQSGIRVIYRPENYRYYSPLGVGAKAYIGYYGTSSEYLTNSIYYTNVIAKADSWSLLTWDFSGKYYYFNNIYDQLTAGGSLGYGVAILNSSSSMIYTDTYRYYSIPSNIHYCEIDSWAGSGDTKCSAAFGDSSDFNSPVGSSTPRDCMFCDSGSSADSGSSTSSWKPDGYSSVGNSDSTGTIVAVVIVVLVLIAVAVGVAVCAKKGILRCRQPPVTSRQPTPTVQYISGQPSTSLHQQQPQQQQMPTYQPVAPSAPVHEHQPAYPPTAQHTAAYQPPVSQPLGHQPPPYQPPAYQPAAHQPPAYQPSYIPATTSASITKDQTKENKNYVKNF